MKKVNGYRQAPGLEWRILKKMLKLALASALVPLMVSGFARLLPMDISEMPVSKQLVSVDIFSIALAITAFTALFTLAFGCVVVVIMKGPRYTADSYELNDADHPKNRKDG